MELGVESRENKRYERAGNQVSSFMLKSRSFKLIREKKNYETLLSQKWSPTLPKQLSLVWEGHCSIANM